MIEAQGENLSLLCELVTPERLELSISAQMVVVPGTEGDFGVLVGHAPFVSTLRPGVITIQLPHQDTRRIAVVSGIAEVSAHQCVILAERVRDLANLTSAEAQAELAAARERVDDALTDEQKAQAESSLALAQVAADAFN